MSTHARLLPAILTMALAASGCGGGGGGTDEDTAIDTVDETVDTAGDTEEDTAGDTTADPEPDTTADAEPDISPDAVSDPTSEDVLEEEMGPGCGNGTLETGLGEVCDDGNEVNEACDTTDTDACLGDCSLLVSACGDGAPDDGEGCDDGDDDSMDDCTTSCTVNDHYIGAPCTCTDDEGGECASVDFTAGILTGCDAVLADVDSTRELACLRSKNAAVFGLELYFPEGYCTLLAFRCTGALCTGFREVGNVDTFTCPVGYAVVTQTQDIFGTIITTKTCHPVCTSQADCRWAAEEDADSPWTGCGQYMCLPAGDAGESICADARLPLT